MTQCSMFAGSDCSARQPVSTVGFTALCSGSPYVPHSTRQGVQWFQPRSPC